MAKKKPPVGRPTLYKSEYCDELIDFCSRGFSITAFAGKIRVSRDTIAEWGTIHREFSEAIKIAKACATLSLEGDASRVRKSGGGPGTAAMIIFGLKNFAPDEYKERRDDDNPLTPEQLASLAPAADISKADEPGPASPRL